MKRHIPALFFAVVMVAASGGVFLFANRAPSQDNAVTVVKSWYRQYLSREPDESGMDHWVNALRSGAPETQILSQFLGSKEYIRKAGKNPRGFIRKLFRDFKERGPSREEMDDWAPRLKDRSYQEVAYEFLQAIGR
jgi:hypothetical protein